MKQLRQITSAALFLLLLSAALFAQQAAQPDSGLLTLDTAFSYNANSLDAVEWQKDGSGYLALEPNADKKGAVDIVRYDATNGARSILVSAAKLVPQGASSALVIEHYDFSADGQKVLVFANSARVWRSNTRGDYWVLDLKS